MRGMIKEGSSFSEKGKAAKKAGTKRAPTPQRLIEDSGIPELDKLAIEYAGIRDQRIALNQEEHALKEKVRTAMHKHKKENYKYGGVHIKLVAGDEDVKVTVKAEKVEIEEE